MTSTGNYKTLTYIFESNRRIDYGTYRDIFLFYLEYLTFLEVGKKDFSQTLHGTLYMALPCVQVTWF